MIFVLGATGFIGSNVSNYLKRMGYEVVGISRRDCDLTNKNDLQSLLLPYKHRGSVVINCAVINKSQGNNYLSFMENNTLISSILESVSCLDIKKFIQLSSFDVYGNNIQKVIDENTKLDSDSWYALAKICAEQMISCFDTLNGKSTILRIPGIYSLDQRDTVSVVSKLKNKIQMEETIDVSNRGKDLRDLVHIDDLCIMLETLLRSKFVIDKINIASGCSFSINEILQMLSLYCKKEAMIAYSGKNLRSFDIRVSTSLLDKYGLTNIIKPISWHVQRGSECLY